MSRKNILKARYALKNIFYVKKKKCLKKKFQKTPPPPPPPPLQVKWMFPYEQFGT